MNSRDQPGTMPLTEREYYALREFFGFMSAVAKHIGLLEKRAKMRPGCWEELNDVMEKTKKIIQTMLETIPIDKLRMVREELPHIRVSTEFEKPNGRRKKSDDYACVPCKELDMLIQKTIDWECFSCEKSGREMWSCPIRKAVDATYPFQTTGDTMTYCKYSGLNIENS